EVLGDAVGESGGPGRLPGPAQRRPDPAAEFEQEGLAGRGRSAVVDVVPAPGRAGGPGAGPVEPFERGPVGREPGGVGPAESGAGGAAERGGVGGGPVVAEQLGGEAVPVETGAVQAVGG